MHPDQKPVHYGDYLQLGKILSAQIPESPKYGKMAHDEGIIKINSELGDHQKEMELKNLEMTRINFKSILDPKIYTEIREKGSVKMSQSALQSAIFIHLYRDQPMLQLPYKILALITDIDEHLTTWRQRHAIMVHRLIGTKIAPA